METRECEIKFELRAHDRKTIRVILQRNGFIVQPQQVETDFVPDTSDFLCRKNNFILRFRHIQSATTSDILLTLKMGKTNIGGFQDARELQYSFSQVDYRIFDHINEMLQKTTGKTLPNEVHSLTNIDEIRAYTPKIGFPSLRMFVQKKRIIFSKGSVHVTFDTFPGCIGKYLEIETQSPEELEKMIDLLRLPREKLELRDYGKIVKDKNSGLSEQERRIALF